MGKMVTTFLSVPPRKAVQLISENCKFSTIVEQESRGTWKIYWDKANDRLLSSSKKHQVTLERHRFPEKRIRSGSAAYESGTVGSKMTWDSGNPSYLRPVEQYELR